MSRRAARPLSLPPFLALLVVILVVAVSLVIARLLIVGDQVPAPGGSYVEAITGSPAAINPLFAPFNEVDEDLASLVFSGLMTQAPNGEALTDLAERWELSENLLTYRFTLRPDARWHDGRPVVAGDVVYTIRTIQDPAFRGPSDLAAVWRSFDVREVDPRTVEIILKERFSPFLSQATLGILPRHILGGVPADRLAEQPFNVEPVGSGRFRLLRATVDFVELEANPDYYRQRPFLDRLTLRFFPDDQAAVAALTRKDVDGLLMRPLTASTSLDRALQDSRLRSYTTTRAATVLLYLNNRDTLFGDQRVRQAMLAALDRNQLVNAATGGRAFVATSPLLPNTWAAQATLADGQNRDRAGQLLDEAGWRGGAGARQKGEARLIFTLLTDDDPVRVQAIQEIARQLESVGVRAEPSISPAGGLIDNFLIPRRYQALVYGLDLGPDPDPYPLWHSSQCPNGYNFACFTDRRMDGLLEEGRLTADQVERSRIYGEFQTAFAERVPSIPLYHPSLAYVMDRRIQGVEVGTLFTPASRFANSQGWYVNTRRAGS